ncbi:MAG: hypothetical protein GEU94_08640 [Micromonosporaceae bacterium]|nr:hypothetical protein [Micromonosporaceae bacterium]
MTMPHDPPLDGAEYGDTPTEQFEPDFDDTEGDGFRLMDRFTCVADAESEPPAQAVGDGSRRRLAVIAVLTAFAVLSGLLVGYATVRSMGGWSATWIGGNQQPGAAPSEDSDDADVRQGAPPSSASPSPSASSASPTASPTTGSSARPRPGVTTTRPAPSPTWTTPSPSPTTDEPPGPQPSRTKKPPNDD